MVDTYAGQEKPLGGRINLTDAHNYSLLTATA